MKHVHHENLVRLIEIVENPSEIILVMELAMTDLFAYMTTGQFRPAGRLPENEAKGIFRQIVEGESACL